MLSLLKNIRDVRGSDAFNAGNCTGWIEALIKDRKVLIKMSARIRLQPLVQITDQDFQVGFEETQEPYYADFAIHIDMGLVEVVPAMLTEVAVESGLSEQQLRCSTGFIIGILSRR
jgi:hypothetical protein